MRNLGPIPYRLGPFLGDVPVGKIDKFFKRGVIGEDSLVLCNLPYLTLITFDGIGRIDDSSDSFGILEKLRKPLQLSLHDLITIG